MNEHTDCGTCDGTGAVARDGGFDPCPNEGPIPVLVEDEKTTPEPAATMAELMARMRSRQPNPMWDCDNGVDDRGGW